MADAQDLKSWASKMACGFESRLRHQSLPDQIGKEDRCNAGLQLGAERSLMRVRRCA